MAYHLDALNRRRPTVRYVMTVDGPEPVQKRSGTRPYYTAITRKSSSPPSPTWSCASWGRISRP